MRTGFGPVTPGFRHVPYNDLDAVRNALSPATVAVLIEGIQGEGGISPASPEYLLGLRQLCDERKLLLLMDAVQCGHFRSGRFQSFQRILEGVPGAASFQPDGVSMAKSLGGGFPMGAFWIREDAHGIKLPDLLGPGSHGTTYGGTPLGCAVALKILDVIERENLAENARNLGSWLKSGLQTLADTHPQVIRSVRGLGFMLGIEFAPRQDLPALARSEKPSSTQVVNRLHEAGVLTIPSGGQVVRLLPALNLQRNQAEEALSIITRVVQSLANG